MQAHGTEPEEWSDSVFARTTLVCSVVAVSLGGLAITGWLFHLRLLASLHKDFIPMAPSAAVAFLVLGGALLVTVFRPTGSTWHTLSLIAGAAVSLLCLWILTQFFLGSSLDVEQLLLVAPERMGEIPVGRMSPITAANFALAGSALLLLHFSKPAHHRLKAISGITATIVLSVGLVVVLGYLYGTPLLYGGNIIPVALPTALACVALGAGLIGAAGPSCWPLSVLAGPSVRARLLRTFLPVMVAVVLSEGWLSAFLLRQSDINPVLVSSLTAVLFVMLVSVIVSRLAALTGQRIDRAEAERMQVEQALRASQSRLQAILDYSDQAIISTDEQQRIILFSKGAESIFGYRADEVMGELIDMLLPAKVVENHRRWISGFGASPVAARMMSEQGLIAGLRKDGSEFPAEGSISKLTLERKKVFTVFLRDITMRRNVEEQLRLAQKMEGIGRLAGGVAHDFNNMLMAITGYCELLLIKLDPRDQLRTHVLEISQVSDRAASLTRQLLAFSRKQVLAPCVLNLNTVVAGMDSMLRRVIGEDIDLRAVFETDLQNVKADLGQMEQVIMNLAVNARDAMPRGGTLTIETANTHLDQEYARQHVGVTPGPYVMVSVNDTGCGMDSDTQARIFEPFFTTKEQGKGTGLGLSTVYGIIKQSGGNIWVYSEIGRGSTFKVYLPRVEESAESSLPQERPSMAAQRGFETIFLVEDENAIREGFREILQTYGYTVLDAPDGAVAIHIAENIKDPIQLLVTDLVMPQMSGREVFERVQSLHPETKVIFMSGYADGAVVQQGILEAGTVFLQKPFSASVLLQKIREVLDA
jgi:PAS domain S-box-containing protein